MLTSLTRLERSIHLSDHRISDTHTQKLTTLHRGVTPTTSVEPELNLLNQKNWHKQGILKKTNEIEYSRGKVINKDCLCDGLNCVLTS